MTLFRKTSRPILGPRPELPWADGAVFNPGVWYDDGVVHLLFRAVPAGYERKPLDDPDPTGPDAGFDDSYVSYLGYAESRDGLHFICREEPFMRPDTDFDRYGAEDPRISKLDGRYLITYTALSEPAFGEVDGVRIGLASTSDFVQVEKHGVVGPGLRDKDAVIFPRLIGGRVAMLHRVVPDIQLIYFDTLDDLLNDAALHWEQHLASLDEHVIMRSEAEWEAKKIGAGPTPVETADGWLLIYHGVDYDHVYRTGLALLDRDDPARVLARTREPVMMPELDFELYGDVDNVVFPEGAAVIDGTLHVYYGAADRVIGHAQAPLDDVLAFMRSDACRPRDLPHVFLERDGRDEHPRSIASQPPVRVERLHGGAPVLEPVADHDWESRVVLNPAAVLVEAGAEMERLMEAWRLDASDRDALRGAGGACVMLYRALAGVEPNEFLFDVVLFAAFTAAVATALAK